MFDPYSEYVNSHRKERRIRSSISWFVRIRGRRQITKEVCKRCRDRVKASYDPSEQIFPMRRSGASLVNGCINTINSSGFTHMFHCILSRQNIHVVRHMPIILVNVGQLSTEFVIRSFELTRIDSSRLRNANCISKGSFVGMIRTCMVGENGLDVAVSFDMVYDCRCFRYQNGKEPRNSPSQCLWPVQCPCVSLVPACPPRRKTPRNSR